MLPLNRDELDQALLNAHARGDRASLITLYEQAGTMAGYDGADEAAGFYLTHAYVFALEAGDGRAGELYQRLRAAGKEE